MASALFMAENQQTGNTDLFFVKANDALGSLVLSSSRVPLSPLILTIKAPSAELCRLFHTEMKRQQIREEEERGVINQENMLLLTCWKTIAVYSRGFAQPRFGTHSFL